MKTAEDAQPEACSVDLSPLISCYEHNGHLYALHPSLVEVDGDGSAHVRLCDSCRDVLAKAEAAQKKVDAADKACKEAEATGDETAAARAQKLQEAAVEAKAAAARPPKNSLAAGIDFGSLDRIKELRVEEAWGCFPSQAEQLLLAEVIWGAQMCGRVAALSRAASSLRGLAGAVLRRGHQGVESGALDA